MKNSLVSARTLARAIPIAPEVFVQWAYEGKIPFHLELGLLRFDYQEVQEAIDARGGAKIGTENLARRRGRWNGRHGLGRTPAKLTGQKQEPEALQSLG